MYESICPDVFGKGRLENAIKRADKVFTSHQRLISEDLQSLLEQGIKILFDFSYIYLAWAKYYQTNDQELRTKRDNYAPKVIEASRKFLDEEFRWLDNCDPTTQLSHLAWLKITLETYISYSSDFNRNPFAFPVYARLYFSIAQEVMGEIPTLYEVIHEDFFVHLPKVLDKIEENTLYYTEILGVIQEDENDIFISDDPFSDSYSLRDLQKFFYGQAKLDSVISSIESSDISVFADFLTNIIASGGMTNRESKRDDVNPDPGFSEDLDKEFD